jgi:hypothetical protein
MAVLQSSFQYLKTKAFIVDTIKPHPAPVAFPTGNRVAAASVAPSHS